MPGAGICIVRLPSASAALQISSLPGKKVWCTPRIPRSDTNNPPFYLVEDVVIPLGVCQLHNPGALQQVGAHCSPRDAAGLIELDLHKLPEAGAVVVPDGLGIAECLQKRIGLKNLGVRNMSLVWKGNLNMP